MLKKQTPLRHTYRNITARRAWDLQVDYRAGLEWRRATAVDVSRKGCRLRVGEELTRASPVSVRLTHTSPGAADGCALSAQVDGTVIWSRVEGLSHQAGIHFSEEAPELAAIIAGLVGQTAPPGAQGPRETGVATPASAGSA